MTIPPPASPAALPGGCPYPMPVVRVIVEDSSGKVLVLRRQASLNANGLWCLPGGKVDLGQTVQQAAARELLEETALDCPSPAFLFYQDSPPVGSGTLHCINFYFACSAVGPVRLNEESSSYAWMGPDELPSYPMAFRNDEGLRRYWAGRRPPSVGPA